MPATVSRNALRARIRAAVQQPNTGGLFSDQTLNDLIAEGVNTVYDALIAARGADYYHVVYDANLVVGEPLFDLPADYYRLASVLIGDRAFAGGRFGGGVVTEPSRWTEVPRLVTRELDRAYNRRGDAADAFSYATTGAQAASNVATPIAQLRFVPTPLAVFGVRIMYLPTCSHYESGGPSDVRYDLINGWEAAVVAHVAAQVCATQEDSTAAYWTGRKAEEMGRIAALAAERDAAQPQQIADRRGEYDGYGYGRDPWRDPWL